MTRYVETFFLHNVFDLDHQWNHFQPAVAVFLKWVVLKYSKVKKKQKPFYQQDKQVCLNNITFLV